MVNPNNLHSQRERQNGMIYANEINTYAEISRQYTAMIIRNHGFIWNELLFAVRGRRLVLVSSGIQKTPRE